MNMIHPTYYVRHPDDTYSVADPQPTDELERLRAGPEPAGMMMAPRDVLQRCRDTAMLWTIQGRIPECGQFGGIAQDLDAILDASPAATAQQAEPDVWTEEQVQEVRRLGAEMHSKMRPAQQAEPNRSERMRAAGFTPRDERLTCEECGAKVASQLLPVHKCPSLTVGERAEWKLVPVEPTMEMVNAFHAVSDSDVLKRGYGRSRWDAMLAAAPARQAEPVASDRQMLKAALADLDISTWQCPRCGHAEDCKTMDVAYMLRRHLEAAFNPPAQAEPVADICPTCKWPLDAHDDGNPCYKRAAQAEPVARMVETCVGADIFVHGVKVPDFPIGTAHNGKRAAFVEAVNRAAVSNPPAQGVGPTLPALLELVREALVAAAEVDGFSGLAAASKAELALTTAIHELYAAQAPADPRCAGCDIENGCPEYCLCGPANAAQAPAAEPRGEFICERCGIRQDAPSDGATPF